MPELRCDPGVSLNFISFHRLQVKQTLTAVSEPWSEE